MFEFTKGFTKEHPSDAAQHFNNISNHTQHTYFTGTDFDYSHGADYGYEADLHIAKLQEHELILT